MDDQYAPRPVRWLVQVSRRSHRSCSWLIGCAGYLVSVLADPASLPLDQRNLLEARPIWQVAAYAIAVWVGLVGAIFLLLRRKNCRAAAARFADRLPC